MKKKLITLIVYNNNDSYYDVLDKDDTLEVHVSTNAVEEHIKFPGKGTLEVRVAKNIAKTIVHGSILVDGKLYTSIEENSSKLKITGTLKMQGIFSMN